MILIRSDIDYNVLPIDTVAEVNETGNVLCDNDADICGLERADVNDTNTGNAVNIDSDSDSNNSDVEYFYQILMLIQILMFPCLC